VSVSGHGLEVGPIPPCSGTQAPSGVGRYRNGCLVFLVVGGWSPSCLQGVRELRAQQWGYPWHRPSWVWAFVGSLSLGLCAILLVIGQATDQAYRRAACLPAGISGSEYPMTTLSAGGSPSWQEDPTGRFASWLWG
jgi:hypothetical protein